MNHAVIDIGSNSIRLAVYQIHEASFSVLFREKVMAGLAGYVTNGMLTQSGIRRAVESVCAFCKTVSALGIPSPTVFATAGLRNIENTAEAVSKIRAASGCEVKVLSGEEEAMLGFVGATHGLSIRDGAVMDIGGASTELVPFASRTPLSAVSLPIGSLRLYSECVRQILPGKNAVQEMRRIIRKNGKAAFSNRQCDTLVGIGGTARAALRLINNRFDLPHDNRKATKEQVLSVCDALLCSKSEAANTLLRLMPERIHTALPGLLILEYALQKLGADTLIVGENGVREGYVCRYLLA